MEIEVFRLIEPSARSGLPNYSDDKFFSVDKCYEHALYTRTIGPWQNQKYFTTNPMQYVGKYVRSVRWGIRDGSGGDEIFNNNGIEVIIHLDYAGTTSFREVPCKEVGTATGTTTGTGIATRIATGIATATVPSVEEPIQNVPNEYKSKYLKYKNKYLKLKNEMK